MIQAAVRENLKNLTRATHLDEVAELASELRDILGEMRFSSSMTVIETNHKIGSAIVQNRAYKRSAHGNGELFKELANRVDKSEKHLYMCVKFVQKFPEVSNALETLQSDTKTLTWRHIVAYLSGHQIEENCAHEVTRKVEFICCVSCGNRVKIRTSKNGFNTRTT